MSYAVRFAYYSIFLFMHDYQKESTVNICYVSPLGGFGCISDLLITSPLLANVDTIPVALVMTEKWVLGASN